MGEKRVKNGFVFFKEKRLLQLYYSIFVPQGLIVEKVRLGESNYPPKRTLKY